MSEVREISIVRPGTKAFVTGGSGFLGRRLIATLAAHGYDVVALVRSPAAEAAVRAAGAEPAFGDLTNEGAMRAAMSGCGVVFHAAALASDWGPKAEFFETNVRGTERALAAAKASGVKRFVHIGTEAVLCGGPPIVNANETWPYPAHPVGNYAWSKGLAERAVVAANGKGIETVVVRPRFIWGIDDTNLLPTLMEAMKGGSWSWFDGGRHLISTCNVGNVCEGALLAAQYGTPGEIYFLTDGKPVVFREFLTDLAKTQGIDAPQREAPLFVAAALAAVLETVWSLLRLGGRPLVTRMAMRLFFTEVTVDDTKARRDLGYASRISIRDGLDELAQASARSAVPA